MSTNKSKAGKYKTASAILGTLGGIGALGGIHPNNSTQDNLHSALGGLLLGGIAYALKKKADKLEGKGKLFEDHHMEAIKKLYNHPIKVGIDELKMDAKKIKNILSKLDSVQPRVTGKGKLKDTFNKAKGKLKDFFQGKTKFKPSTLLNISSKVLGGIGTISSFVPILEPIGLPATALSVASKVGSDILKNKGKGKKRGRPKKQKGKGLLDNAGKSHIPELRGDGMNQSGEGLLTTGNGLKNTGNGLNIAGNSTVPMRKKRKSKYGSRSDVYLGNAQLTRGGLKKEDIIYDDKSKRYKSKKMVGKGKALYQMKKNKKK